MARNKNKGRKNSTKGKHPQPSGSSSAAQPSQLDPANETPSKTFGSARPLPLAGPATPAKITESETIISPELQRAMRDEAAKVTAIQVTPKERTGKDDAFIAHMLNNIGAALRHNQDEQRHLEAKREQVTEQLAKLDEMWNEATSELSKMPQYKYRRERQKALVMQQQLCSQLAQMYTRNALLRSGWMSDMLGGKVPRDALEDYAIIDPVIRCFPELDGARTTVKQQRTEQKQMLFRRKLIARHDAAVSSSMAYCQISHDREENVTAAHIVNVNVGYKTAEALFGAREDHIWSEKNGLVIHKAYERLLDEAKAVVLPISNRPDETEFELVLLTRDIGDQQAHVWGYDELHHRRLQFRTAFRPAKRYLYFKAVMSLLRRRRANVDGHETDLETLSDVGRTMWASPKPYLKNSIMYRFSRELGGMSQEAADRFWGIEGSSVPLGDLSLEDQETVEQIAVLATHAAIGEDDVATGEDTEDTRGGSKGKGKVLRVAKDDDPFV